MSEISISFFCEQFGISRKKSVILSTVIAMGLGSLCALSFGSLNDVKIFGMTIFDLFDYTTSNIMLPLGGMLISIFVGWFMDRTIVRRQLEGVGTIKNSIFRLIVFCLRYVAPLGIGLVFLGGLGVI